MHEQKAGQSNVNEQQHSIMAFQTCTGNISVLVPALNSCKFIHIHRIQMPLESDSRLYKFGSHLFLFTLVNSYELSSILQLVSVYVP